MDYAKLADKALKIPDGGGIYCIQNIENGKRYIGSAIIFKDRWRGHKSLLNKNKHHSKKLQNAWNKYGADKFIFSILELVIDNNFIIEREQYWIDLFLNKEDLYNTCLIAGNTLGFRHSEESKLKISISSKNMIRTPEHCAKISESQKDKVIPIEQREQISKTLTGRTLSDETIEKIVKSRAGFKHTEESKIKMSKSQTGRVVSDEARKNMSIAKIKYWENATDEERRNCGRPGIKQSAETIEKRASKLRGRKMEEGVGYKRWETRRANILKDNICL